MRNIRHLLMLLIVLNIITGGINITPAEFKISTEVDNVPSPIRSDVYDVNFDGIISVGEYFETLDFTGMKLHYMVNNSIIYMALEAQVTGYVAIGLGGVGMDGADIMIGYYSTGAFIQDNIGIGPTGHIKDTVNNILNYGGSDDGTTTIIEFSRYLDTGDATEDTAIVLDASMDGIWAKHSTKDDFTTTHDSRARISGLLFQSYLPSNPRALTGSPSDKKAMLSWDAPSSDGGKAITAYNIYRSTTQGSGYSLLTSTTQTTYNDSGLTNGQNYYYKVRAETGKGESTDSNEIMVQPTAQISEPLNVVAIAYEGEVGLSWDAPLLDGGSAIVKYNIYRSEVSGGPYSQIGSNTTLIYNDSAVVNGIQYYYTVRAENSYAEGDSSTEVSAMPYGISPNPSNLRGFATDTNITLLWDEPISDGGAAITAYNIYRGSIEGGPYNLVGSNDSVTGFIDTTAVLTERYFYIVTSINSYGESLPSNEYGITFAKTPYVIENVTISASYLNVTLEWVAPTGDFNPITNYTIYRFDFAQEIFLAKANTTNTFFSDLSVSNAVEYTYLVTAWNDQGESPYSGEYSIIPGEVPGMVQSLTIEMDDRRIKLAWESPLNDGGFNITEYRIYRYNDVVYSGLDMAINDTDVVNGQIYSYFVVAVNIVGEGMRTGNITGIPGTTPSIPPQPQAEFLGSSVKITWNSSTYDGGYAITNYNVYKSLTSGDTSPTYVGRALSSFDDNSFIKGVTYYYSITANNSMGESDLSLEVAISIPLNPTPPLNLVAIGGDNFVGLSWSTPLIGTDLLNYTIYRSEEKNGTYTAIGNSTEISFTDTDVQNNNTYWYYVTAINQAGESGPSNLAVALPLKPVVISPPVPSTNNTIPADEGYFNTFMIVSIVTSAAMITVTTIVLVKLKRSQG